MKNELNTDPSPYLQQHKDNPVHWKTWSPKSLSLAKKEKKPIILSVGYSSCHWCHVMAHESFEDTDTAKYMNENFVNIKVDREERPDLDFLFQSSFQLFNQSGGGWPLTMFLDENAVPFMGGTYFPNTSKHNIPSFKVVMKQIIDVYKNQRERIIDQSNLIKKSLEPRKSAVINQDYVSIIDQILPKLDPINGGFKGAPKFPTFYIFDVLIYFFNKKKNKKYYEPVNLLLNKICSQGIYDHVEGGICRYTVDEKWLIPHFEKMLYDNLQFISLISKILRIKKDDYFLKKLKQTINFLEREFVDKETGLLGSAYDADSDGEEGKYYIYSYNELKNIKDIEDYFEINPNGNWEGKTILKELKQPNNEILNALIKIRKKRKKPFFDNKTQMDLNSLWISVLIQAHKVTPKENYIKKAEIHYKNLEKKYVGKKFYHSYSEEHVFLEDYAFLIQALIDLGENTLILDYRNKAKELCDEAIKNFYCPKRQIFQKNCIKKNGLFFEPIDIGDHTVPNGNSVMLKNFARLKYFCSESNGLAKSIEGYLNVYKNYMLSSVKSLDFYNNAKLNINCNEEGCDIN